MLSEKVLKVGGGQLKKISKMCPKHEQRMNMLSNQQFTVRQPKTNGQTRHTRNMKKSIQLVLTTFFCSVLLMRKYYILIYFT